jgi:hypothetical protein
MQHQQSEDSLKFFVSKPKLLLVNFFLVLIIGVILTSMPMAGLFFKGLLLLVFIIVSLLWTIFLPAIFDSSPQIIIDNVGVLIRNNPSSPVLWDDIVNVQITSRKALNYLLINVKNPESYSISGTQTKKPHFTLSFFLLKPSSKEALAYIRSRYQDKLKETTV